MAAALRRWRAQLYEHRYWLHRWTPPLGLHRRTPGQGAQRRDPEPAHSPSGPAMTRLCKRVEIINKLGLHARAAAKFVGVAKQHDCSILIGGNEQQMVDGKSIMQVMMLAASKGTEVCITCEGEQAEQAMDELLGLINDYFGEGE